MAGSHPSFDAAQFRESIKFAMDMGLPSDPTQRATFRFRKTTSWPPGTRLDQEGNAIDPNVSPIVSEPDPVQISCAVEFSQASPEELPVGQIVQAKATITVLDVDYEKVQGAVEVDLGGDRYVIRYEEPPVGLFEVTVHRLVCYAKDEN